VSSITVNGGVARVPADGPRVFRRQGGAGAYGL
jgi:hypothetical protein